MSKTKTNNPTRTKLKKEVDAWITEDYPVLAALKHPYISILSVLIGIAVAAFVAALSVRSIEGALVVIFMFVPVAYFHIKKR